MDQAETQREGIPVKVKVIGTHSNFSIFTCTIIWTRNIVGMLIEMLNSTSGSLIIVAVTTTPKIFGHIRNFGSPSTFLAH